MHVETHLTKEIYKSIHLQSTINIEGDKVVDGLPDTAEPDNLTSKPCSGEIYKIEVESYGSK